MEQGVLAPMSLQKLWMKEVGHGERGEAEDENKDVIITDWNDGAESQRRKIITGDDKEESQGRELSKGMELPLSKTGNTAAREKRSRRDRNSSRWRQEKLEELKLLHFLRKAEC